MRKKNDNGLKRKFLLPFIVLFLLILNFKFFSQSLENFVYGDTIENTIFIDFTDKEVNFPPPQKPSIVFFISGSPRNFQSLNEMFYVIDQIKADKQVYIFAPEIKKDSYLIKLNKNVKCTIIPVNKNKSEKQQVFISKACSTCFSMMLIVDNKVKFFRQGYDYYLFKEVIKNLSREN